MKPVEWAAYDAASATGSPGPSLGSAPVWLDAKTPTTSPVASHSPVMIAAQMGLTSSPVVSQTSASRGLAAPKACAASAPIAPLTPRTNVDSVSCIHSSASATASR